VCRHLAYIGPPSTLGSLLIDPDHSLVDQARHARFQSSGASNPDGWGVGWYDGEGATHRHRTATPIWDDPELSRLSTREHAGVAVAAVRLASPGAPLEASGNAPFVADNRWLFSLNGIVDGFADGVGDDLRARVSPSRSAGIEGRSDSEVLFALVLDRLDAGIPAVDALADVIGTVEARTTGRLNLLLADDRTVSASAVGNSLFHLGARVVASEPLDDAEHWEPVADRTVVGTDGAELRASSL